MSMIKNIEIDGKQVSFRTSAAIPSIPDTPEEWLDAFNTFSIYQVLPKIIELWGLNVRTDAEAKKNFAQQTVR